MRILFFGTAEFAVPSLQGILGSGAHEVLSVVTQPDKPQGRGQQVIISPIKKLALQHGLPVKQPRRVRSELFLQQAREMAPDALVVAAFGQIISQALLDLPPVAPINVHGSLLPAYRGAAPIQHAILNGETVTGVTTMWMDATLDTGDILLARSVDIDPEDTTGTLTPKLAAVGAELLLETLDRLTAGNCPRIPQDDAGATYAPPVTPEDGRIRWEEPAERCRDRVRAMSPRPGAYTALNGRRVKLWQATVENAEGSAGEVLAAAKTGVVVGTGKGALLLQEVQAENSRRMSAADWARGARIKPGDRFE